jgi:hypothetical protein
MTPQLPQTQLRLIRDGITREEFRARFGMTDAAMYYFSNMDRAAPKLKKPTYDDIPSIMDGDVKKIGNVSVRCTGARYRIAQIFLKNPSKQYEVAQIAKLVPFSELTVRDVFQFLRANNIITVVKIETHAGIRRLWRACS